MTEKLITVILTQQQDYRFDIRFDDFCIFEPILNVHDNQLIFARRL